MTKPSREGIMKYAGLVAIVITVAVGVDACCSCREAVECATRDGKPFTIEYVAGGGVSGHHGGYLFSSEGKVERISWMPGRDRDASLLDSERKRDICELKNLIDSIGISTMGVRGTGNMTTRLTVRVDETEEYFVSWSGTMSEMDLVPRAVYPVVKRILALIEEIEQR